MKLKAWMEMYLYRSRQKKPKKDKKNKSDTPSKDISATPPGQGATATRPKAFIVANEGCFDKTDKTSHTPRAKLRHEDHVNSNTIYESLDDLKTGHTPAMESLDQSRISSDYQTGSSLDVRRTPSLGIRSRSVYTRGNSINEQSDNSGPRSSEFPSINNSLYSSLSNVPNTQACLSPVTRSKIKTNPWYRTLRSSSAETGSTSTYSTLSNSSKSFRSETSSEFSAMEESSSSCAEISTAPSSNSSTLDSAYRVPSSILKSGLPRSRDTSNEPLKKDISFETQQDSTYKLTESVKRTCSVNRNASRDSGYLSQDFKYRSLTKDRKRAEEEQDTDDSGTLMEKEWSSPEVEICDIIPAKKLTTSIEVDEAYSEISSLPSESPDDDRFPEFQKLSIDETARENSHSTKQWSNDKNSRTISNICGSLEEKVQRLRFERLLVEEKIKEAREEDRIRCEEKMKFQREMIVHRRQILLRTLQNIRVKLEDQGLRLQDAYNATLGMQMSVRRNNVAGMDSGASDKKTSRICS